MEVLLWCDVDVMIYIPMAGDWLPARDKPGGSFAYPESYTI